MKGPGPLPSRIVLFLLPIILIAAQDPPKLCRNHSRAVFSDSDVFKMISLISDLPRAV